MEAAKTFWFAKHRFVWHLTRMNTFRIGDWVVYQKEKVSTHPGPRACEVFPSEHGEDYSYMVPKFWQIVEIPDDEHVVVATRTGKRHTLRAADSHLSKASLIDRLRYRDRFPNAVA